MAAKRYVVMGTGARGVGMFARPLAEDFPGQAELVGLCDANPLRVAAAAAMLPVSPPQFTDFQEMLAAVDPDGVIVATRDSTHAEYVVAALQAGKRAISEKPLCTTAEQCRAILAAAADSDGLCRVTHNARYGAAEGQIKSMLDAGRLGRVRFMQFDETLDRCHGADYFRRWHRFRAHSGGLLVHKACHHFDVLNWWAGSRPQRVSAQGALSFYGANGPFHHARCRGCPHAQRCDFHADMFKLERYRKLYLEAESADGYFRDGCVFDPAIDIADQMSVHIRYDGGIEVAYTLTAYSPYESQRTIIEGSEGRLEYFSRSNTGWVVDAKPLPGIEQLATERLELYLPGTGRQEVPIRRVEGGHGGADPQLRAEFFARPWEAEPTERMASVEQAVQAVLVGAAANESMATGQPVEVQQLLEG